MDNNPLKEIEMQSWREHMCVLMGLDLTITLEMINMWININGKGATNHLH